MSEASTSARSYYASLEQSGVSDKPVDLYTAMARALKFNLKRRQSVAEAVLSDAEISSATVSMLPSLAIDAGYASRDKVSASTSLNVFTDTLGNSASTSEDLSRASASLSFGWNILDFGLSYVRAEQAADKYLIEVENRRKVTQKLLEDVRVAYWRAVTFENLSKSLRAISNRVQTAKRDSSALSKNGQTPRIAALLSQRELLDLEQTIRNLQRQTVSAKTELGALMGMRPDMAYILTKTPQPEFPRTLPMSSEDMMLTALRDRPELREIFYRQRINVKEANAALLQLLPGFQPYVDVNWDSNSYLLNNNWTGWGLASSWNLLKVFQYPAHQKVIAARDDVLKAQAQAVSMAVVTQVYLARVEYDQFLKTRNTANEYRVLQGKLVKQYKHEVAAGRISEQELLSEELKLVLARARNDLATSDLQGAYAMLFTSIGWDPYGEIDTELTAEQIADALKTNWLQACSLETMQREHAAL